MRFTKKQIASFTIVLLITAFISLYELPYYINTPGKADDLEKIVKVKGGEDITGSYHLLTVSTRPATLLFLALSVFDKNSEIVPAAEARPDGMSQKEYFQMQLHMMESSQQASTVVAYQAAKADIDVEYKGVYVLDLVEGMPAEKQLEVGDVITQIDSVKIQEASDLMNYIKEKEANTQVRLQVLRDDQAPRELEVALAEFEGEEKVGLGIQLITNRDVKVKPDVEFSSGKIGGPSAGLMFALSIYDQLTEEDLSKGLKIAGSGQLDYEGNVLSIGGIDKKLVAAEKNGIDILFVPDVPTKGKTNYQVALKKKNEINAQLELVPVKKFTDVLSYLKEKE